MQCPVMLSDPQVQRFGVEFLRHPLNGLQCFREGLLRGDPTGVGVVGGGQGCPQRALPASQRPDDPRAGVRHSERLILGGQPEAVATSHQVDQGSGGRVFAGRPGRLGVLDNEGGEVVQAVPGGEVVVQARFAVRCGRELADHDVRALAAQVAGEGVKGLADTGVAAGVRVERQDHPPAIEGDVLPVRQGDLPAAGVGCAPVPHTGQRDARQTEMRCGVGFARSFGDPQIDIRVTELRSDAGRHVEPVRLPARRLVFDRPARLGGARVVRAVLEADAPTGPTV